MTLKTGIWIDHKEAMLVLLTDAGEAIQKISLTEEKPATSDGKSRPKQKYTPNDFVAEDRLERKTDAALKAYYDRVLASIQGVTSILVLGPGEAKLEFQKRIQAKKLKGVTVEIETADKLTDRQLVAKVQKHFEATAAAKKATPKKSSTNTLKKAAKKAPKKAAKAPLTHSKKKARK